MPAAGRRSTKGEPSSTQAVRHRPLRVPPAVVLHVFAVRHGRSPARARLCAARLCVRVAVRHSQTSRPGERGRAARAAVTAGRSLLSAHPGGRRQLCPQPGAWGGSATVAVERQRDYLVWLELLSGARSSRIAGSHAKF